MVLLGLFGKSSSIASFVRSKCWIISGKEAETRGCTCAALTQSWNVQHVGNAPVTHLHIRQVLLATLLHNLLQRLGHVVVYSAVKKKTPMVWTIKSLYFGIVTTPATRRGRFAEPKRSVK